MKPQTPPSELSLALDTIRPAIVRAALFSMIISFMALAPTVYMLEVYDRVVNSRSGMTLAMLTLMIVGAYAVMEILEKVRGALLRQQAWPWTKNCPSVFTTPCFKAS